MEEKKGWDVKGASPGLSWASLLKVTTQLLSSCVGIGCFARVSGGGSADKSNL